MIAAVTVLAALGAGVQQPAAEPVRLRVELAAEAVLREQPFVVRVEVELDEVFLRERMLQPFRRAIECPIQLEVPWLAGAADWLVRAPVTRAESAPLWRLVLNGEVVAADAVTEGQDGDRAVRILTLERTVLALADGARVLAAPIARYAWTPDFASDVFGTPVPSERRDAVATGAARTLTVQAWPEAGRPPDFRGAVGALTLRVARAADDAPDCLTMELWIEGEGNWESWTAPALDALPGLHLLGQIEHRSAGMLAVRAEFLLEDPGLREFPALAYPFLDPEPPTRYRHARSAALPLAPAASAPSALTAIAEPPPARESMRPALRVLLGLLVAAGFGLLWLRFARRRTLAPAPHAGAPLAPRPPPPPDPGRDPTAAWTAYLAELLGAPESTLHDPDLEARLRACGLSPELAARGAELFERLQAARYGGAVCEGAEHEVRAALAEFRAALPAVASSVSAP